MLFSEKNNKYRENTHTAQLPGDLWGLHGCLKPASWFCRQQHLTPRGKRPGGESQGHRFFLLLPQFGRARGRPGVLGLPRQQEEAKLDKVTTQPQSCAQRLCPGFRPWRRHPSDGLARAAARLAVGLGHSLPDARVSFSPLCCEVRQPCSWGSSGTPICEHAVSPAGKLGGKQRKEHHPTSGIHFSAVTQSLQESAT